MTAVTFEYSNKQIQLSKAKLQLKVCGLDIYIEDYSLWGDLFGSSTDRLCIGDDWTISKASDICIGAAGRYLAVGIETTSKVNVGGALIYKSSFANGYSLCRKLIPHSTVTQIGSAITIDSSGDYLAVRGMEGEVPYVYVYRWDYVRETYMRMRSINLQYDDFVNDILITYVYMPWTFTKPITLELVIYHPSNNRALEVPLDGDISTLVL